MNKSRRLLVAAIGLLALATFTRSQAIADDPPGVGPPGVGTAFADAMAAVAAIAEVVKGFVLSDRALINATQAIFPYEAVTFKVEDGSDPAFRLVHQGDNYIMVLGDDSEEKNFQSPELLFLLLDDDYYLLQIKQDNAFGYAIVRFDNNNNTARLFRTLDRTKGTLPRGFRLCEEGAGVSVDDLKSIVIFEKTRISLGLDKPDVSLSIVSKIASGPPLGLRVALVIGNGAYQSVPALNNPVPDAYLVASALKADGFSVTLADNVDHDGLANALKGFAAAADGADWAVVYFAGHGIEVGGSDYLIPVDAKLATDRDVSFEAIPMDQVMTAIEGAHALRVVILDACRNNPFAANMKRTTATFRDVGRGLARVEPTQGTMIVYSARPGQVAHDGDGPDSPFATSLARHLNDPGVEIVKLFRLVRDDVLAATNNSQEVFQDSSLPGQDFFFRAQ
jgi:hypothetical protein